MNVYIVEYCNAVTGVYSSKKKALDAIKNDVKKYAETVGNDRHFVRDYKSEYEIFKMKMDEV